jgi:hypothetical protein
MFAAGKLRGSRHAATAAETRSKTTQCGARINAPGIIECGR